MSLFAVHRICHLVQRDVAFRDALLAAPGDTLAGVSDLTRRERAALESGDVATLYDMGAHPLLLARLQRYGIGGLDQDSYVRQIQRPR